MRWRAAAAAACEEPRRSNGMWEARNEVNERGGGRSHPEQLLQRGSLRLRGGRPPIRGTQHLACVRVHVVGVARRLRGCEEGERVGARRRGVGVGVCEGGVRHLWRWFKWCSSEEAREDAKWCRRQTLTTLGLERLSVDFAGDEDSIPCASILYTSICPVDCVQRLRGAAADCQSRKRGVCTRRLTFDGRFSSSRQAPDKISHENWRNPGVYAPHDGSASTKVGSVLEHLNWAGLARVSHVHIQFKR